MYLIISRENKTVNFKEKLISGRRIAMLVLLGDRQNVIDKKRAAT